MKGPRARIGAEVLVVALVLASLAGALASVIELHRRRGSARPPTAPPVVVQRVVEPPAPPPPPPVEPDPEPPAPPPLPEPEPIDPTPGLVAKIAAAEAEQRAAAAEADRKTEQLARTRRQAVARSESWKRREQLARAQLGAMTRRADELERDAESLAIERDLLAQERDAARAAIETASQRSSYSVLPHKTLNGTWRRPIVIECRNGSAKILPDGPSFSLLELSSLQGVRSSPLVGVVAREAVKAQKDESPDGAAIVPYVFFLVRPDGIRPYYESRARLETLGMSFGYELVDADWEVEVPRFDEPGSWGDSVPARPAAPPRLAGRTPVGATDGVGGGGEGNTQGKPGEGSEPGPYVWRQTAEGGRAPASARSGLDGILEGLPEGGRPPLEAILGREDFSSLEELERFGGYAPGSGPAGGRSGTGSSGDGREKWPASGSMGSVVGGGGGGGGSGDGGFGGAGDGSGGGGPGRRPIGLPGGIGGQALHGAGIGQLARLSGGRGAGGSPSGLGGRGPTPGGSPGGGAASGSATGGGGQPGGQAGSPGGQSGSAGGGGASQPGSGQPGSGTGGGSGSGGGGEPGFGARMARRVPLVISCDRDGLTIHPGSYRLTKSALEAGDHLLARQLDNLVASRRLTDPSVSWQPTIRFLVGSGGRDTYWEARKQTMLARPDWPIELQVEEANGPRLLPGGFR